MAGKSVIINSSDFQVSSFCSAGECVAVARLKDGTVLVRDNKEASGSKVLNFTHDEWGMFVKAVKNGEFDAG